MEINTTLLGLTAELRVQGRVDTFWAEHLREAVDYTLDQGARSIRLHLAKVDYLSSAGIRALITSSKKVNSMNGRLEIVQPSASARAILDMAGLTDMIRSSAEEAVETETPAREVPTTNAIFHIHELGTAATMQCSIAGNPAGIRSGHFRGNDSRNLMFPDSTFGLGLGAFGSGYEECRGRHGEFIALAGAAAYQPTDGSEVPEYMMSEGDWVPELNVLYGIWAQGRFTKLLRFDSKMEPGAVPLTEILQVALATAESDTIGFAMLAETEGLLGIGLKRSTAGLKNLETPLSFREVRKVLSGDPKRLNERVLSIIVGVASLSPPDELEPLFPQLAPGSPITGHVNAAVFPKHSIDEGHLDLRKTVQALFQSESLSELLHLMPDEARSGLEAESHFLRGACWVGAIDAIAFGES